MASTIPVSIGVFVHNEESNIARSLDSILKQKTEIADIREIFVVSSGSSDHTNQIIRKYSKQDTRIKFLEQFKREGKSSAVNLFIHHASCSICVIASGDLRLHSRAIEEIILPFQHQDVGMVGGHPIPVNVSNNPVGQEIRLLWKLHHIISLHTPKCGEMVAFRRVIHSIPKQSFDEASLEVLLQLIGYKTVYAPQAIVYNKGPKNISDYITQRRRNYVGHKWISKRYNYQVSTMDTRTCLNALQVYFYSNPKDIFYLGRLLAYESFARLLGWFDFNVLKNNPYIWKMVQR